MVQAGLAMTAKAKFSAGLLVCAAVVGLASVFAGQTGEFHVNLEQGASDFFVGENSLDDILSNPTGVREVNGLNGGLKLVGADLVDIQTLPYAYFFRVHIRTNDVPAGVLQNVHAGSGNHAGDVVLTNAGSRISIHESANNSTIFIHDQAFIGDTTVDSVNGATGTVQFLFGPKSGYGSLEGEFSIWESHGRAPGTYSTIWYKVTSVLTYTNLAACVFVPESVEESDAVEMTSSKPDRLDISSTALSSHGRSFTVTPHTPSLAVSTVSASPTGDYSVIWMDSETAGAAQTLTLPEATNTFCQTVTVYHLGPYPGTVVYKNDSYTLSGDGDSLVFDWLAYRTNWYPRPNY